MCDGVRRHLAASGEVEPPIALADRELIERHVARVSIKPQSLEVCLTPACEASDQAEDPIVDEQASGRPQMATIRLAWTAPSFTAVKGIIHAPCAKPAMRPESRDALLAAIAKARRWIDDIRLGRIATFAEIAELGAQGERHIRLLAPLAFLSPRIIAAIVDGTAPADSHGHRSRQGSTLFLDRARAEVWALLVVAAIDPSGINQGRNQHPAPNTPELGDSTKAPSMAVDFTPKSRQTSRKALHKPVSVRNRTSLHTAETEIGK